MRPEAVAPRADRPAAGRPKGMQLGKAKKATDMLTAMAKVHPENVRPASMQTTIGSVSAGQRGGGATCSWSGLDVECDVEGGGTAAPALQLAGCTSHMFSFAHRRAR